MVTDDKFEKFTERARNVLSLAQEEARRFNHNYIGTEHLLLGLVREETGVAAKVLSNLGVEINKVRSAVEFIIGRGDRIFVSEPGLTPRAKKVIELAVDEARRLNHHYIGTEHLLVGLLREGEGIATGVLESLGVDLENVRIEVGGLLSLGSRDHNHQSRPWTSEEKMQLLTSVARQAMQLAQEEARRFFSESVMPEHLLLGLVRQERAMSARVLKQLGMSADLLRTAIESDIGYGAPTRIPSVTFSLQSEDVLERATIHATNREHSWDTFHIGTGDILLALTEISENRLATVLQTVGAQIKQVRLTTLREFGLLMTQDNDGENLVASMENPVTPPAPTSAAAGSAGKRKIFVSNSHEDQNWCRSFCEVLVGAGYDVWYDHSLHGGAEWVDVIEQQIKQREVFILLLSPEASTSYWVRNELRLAQRIQRNIIPVQVRMTPVHDTFLGNMQIINASEIDGIRAARLVEAALVSNV